MGTLCGRVGTNAEGQARWQRKADKPGIEVPMVSSDLNVKTAWLYYVEGLTQEQIAESSSEPRQGDAHPGGMHGRRLVITTINAETTAQVVLERALEKRWGLMRQWSYRRLRTGTS